MAGEKAQGDEDGGKHGECYRHILDIGPGVLRQVLLGCEIRQLLQVRPLGGGPRRVVDRVHNRRWCRWEIHCWLSRVSWDTRLSGTPRASSQKIVMPSWDPAPSSRNRRGLEEISCPGLRARTSANPRQTPGKPNALGRQCGASGPPLPQMNIAVVQRVCQSEPVCNLETWAGPFLGLVWICVDYTASSNCLAGGGETPGANCRSLPCAFRESLHYVETVQTMQPRGRSRKGAKRADGARFLKW